MTDLECTLSITQGISSSLAHPGALLRSIHEMTISDLLIFPFFNLRMVERCHSPSAAIRAGVWVSPWLSSC